MSKVNVLFESVSGERLEELENFSSSDIQLSSDLKILEIQSKEGCLIVPFAMNIKYDPPIGRISLEGKAEINGDENELQEIKEKHQNNEDPPEEIVRKIMKQNLVESAILSKTLNIPSPIPLPKSLKDGDQD